MRKLSSLSNVRNGSEADIATDTGPVALCGRMSLYKRSWLFTAWVLVVFFSFPLWITPVWQLFGTAGIVAGAALWLGHGIAALFLFRCPECGLSPFVSGKGYFAWSTPWPRRICGHCGHDHTRDR